MNTSRKLEPAGSGTVYSDFPQIFENALLDHFANQSGATLLENKLTLLGEQYSLFRSLLNGFSGSGRDSSRQAGCLKAVAECFERAAVAESFTGPLSHVPDWRRSSNGFAVHFDSTKAGESAIQEALERHILQITYFKEGWAGYSLIDKTFDSQRDMTFTRIESKYSCNGFRAGIVMATSPKFSGVSMGYCCDKEKDFESSPRWKHAHFEAADKVEPMLAALPALLLNELDAIPRAAYDWLLGNPIDFKFAETLVICKLPAVSIIVQSFNLAKKWELNFPFVLSFASGDEVLPLLIPGKISNGDRIAISRLLVRFGLASDIPERNPII